MALLEFEQLSFAYPYATRRALSSVNLCVASGEYVVLCGPSGCGKTTLLRQAKRELRPAGAVEGYVRYNNICLEELESDRSFTEIGFVQQNPEDQIVTDFVWHELAFGLENLALPTPVIRRRVAEMASFFGMETWFRKKTSELSGGQKQMLNLAAVMAMDPKLLILDEPTSMLDPLAARSLLDTVERINRELGVAVLLTEHRLDAVFPVADRVLVMDGGQVVADGKPQEIAHQLSSGAARGRLYDGLPAPVRICGTLGDNPAPLTVRDARRSLQRKLGDAQEGTAPKRKKTPQPDEGNKPMLRSKELWFRYAPDQPDILRGAALSLYPGELLCLLGGNGAGKTTLLKVLVGVQKAQRGKVTVGKTTHLAMLPQSPQSIFTQDTVLLDLLESGEETQARSWAERLELMPLLERHPFDLSGGEMQRAALCKLLLREANVLLLDEPTKGLDAYAKRALAEILRNLTADGTSILVVTHDVEFAASWSDRCAMMFDGRIISSDEPHAFFAGNRFYTTDANRIAGAWFPEAITCEEVTALCREVMGT